MIADDHIATVDHVDHDDHIATVDHRRSSMTTSPPSTTLTTSPPSIAVDQR
jgi:hypothetical protein